MCRDIFNFLITKKAILLKLIVYVQFKYGCVQHAVLCLNQMKQVYDALQIEVFKILQNRRFGKICDFLLSVSSLFALF